MEPSTWFDPSYIREIFRLLHPAILLDSSNGQECLNSQINPLQERCTATYFQKTSLIIFLPIFAFANFFLILEASDWLILNSSTFQITFDSFGYFRDRFTHFRGRNYSFGLHSSNILRISPCQKTVLVLRQWC